MSDTANPTTIDTAASEVWRERFENAWRACPDGAQPPRWEQFLPVASEPCSPALIFLLIQIDIECRAKAGLSALLAERYFEHPRLRQDDARLDAGQQVELIRWEYQQRWQNGARALRADYEAAFPEHADVLRDLKPRSCCPRCRKMIVLEETWQTFCCPQCGDDASRDGQVPPFVPERPPAVELPLQFDSRVYRLVEQLGKGGMGEVYRSSDPALERDLAIKVMKADLRGHPECERRFLREARVTGSLQHPGIVAIHNLGRLVDGRLHYTMRLVRGGTLAEILKDEVGKPERLPALLGIFEKMCQAVAYAHSKRVIHRDLKPSNVMVGRFGEVQVMDWGLAKLLTADEGMASTERPTEEGGTRIRTESANTPSDMTRAGRGMGTPAYMSPEQASGDWEVVDERTDVFALGAILCELLTGQPPYSGTDGNEMLRRARRGDLTEALARLESCGADAALRMLCRDCLAPELEGRPRDADAVAKRVAAYQAEVQERLREAERARAAAQTSAAERRARRRMVLLAAAVLLLAVGGVLLWRQHVAWMQAETARQRAEAAEQEVEQSRDQLVVEKRRTEGALAREQEAKKSETVARKELEHLSYLYQVDLAYRAWRDNNIGHADQLLASCDPRQRGWEWGYVYRLCHTELQTLKGHTHHVTCAAFSPDGRYLASASDDRTVRLWDPVTSRHLRTLTGHANCILGVAFSPDGQRLASASWDKTIKIWEARSGQLVLSLKGHTGRVWSVAFSPDGKRLASTADDRTVRIWDAGTGEEVLTLNGHTDITRSVAFSPDGKRLASASYDQTVKVWDTITGQAIFTFKGHTGWVLSVVFSADGQHLASASLDETVRIWNLSTKQVVFVLQGHTGLVWKAVFSSDGQQLASASRDGTVKIWEPRTGRLVRTLKGHTLGVTCVAFSPDSKHLASASWDGTVKVWDASTSQEARTLQGHTHPALSVAFSPDGTRLASASVDQCVRIWHSLTGREIFALKGHTGAVLSVAFSPDGRRLASASSVDFFLRLPVWMRPAHDASFPVGTSWVKLWDAQTGAELLTLKGHTKGVHSVVFSPDGKRLATASEDGTVKLWDAQTGAELLTLKGHTKGVHSVVFSPDGRRLASASEDWDVKVWDAQTGKQSLTLQGHTAEVYSVSFTSDGTRLASASWDGTVKLWDTITGGEVRTLHGHTGPIYSVAFSPDGRRLASASGDRMVKIWDAASGQEVLTLQGHTDAIHSIVFSADGQCLASASWDRTVKVWEARIDHKAGREQE